MKGKQLKINWSVWGFLLVFSLAGFFVFSAIVPALPGPHPETGIVPLETVVVKGVSKVFLLIVIGLVVTAGASLLLKLLNTLPDAIAVEDAPKKAEYSEEDIIREHPFYQEVREDGKRMLEALKHIQAGRQDATARIAQAVELSNSLASLVKRSVNEMQYLQEEYQFLRDVADAITANDADKLSEAIGSLTDEGLTSMVIVAMSDPNQAGRARRAILVEAGSLSNQVRATGHMVNGWMDMFEEARSEIGRLSVVSRQLEAGAYILQIDTNLYAAQEALRAFNSPDAVVAAEQLPATDATHRNAPRLR